ncbi:MAG: hypothetical protein U0638_05530 [Phycisphaerales bacterium]
MSRSSSDILDLRYHPHDDSPQAMQVLAMIKGVVGAASQEQLKTGNVCKTGGAQRAGSWVSFWSQDFQPRKVLWRPLEFQAPRGGVAKRGECCPLRVRADSSQRQ